METHLRACRPCRLAKVKCDQIRPVCGRCARRGSACMGYTEDTTYAFRNENAVAKRNSQKARGRQPELREQPPASRANPTTTRNASPMGQLQDVISKSLPWLKSGVIPGIPREITGQLEARVVDRYFTNWVLYPCNHGFSPGHLHELPALYHSSQPGGALQLALEAVAYADLGTHHDDGGAMTLRARTKYGAALSRIREIILDEDKVILDSVLAALLLIDNFELVHLARKAPLGPHSTAVLHMLHARGTGQIFSPRAFAFWRIAHHRLLARQIMLRQAPDAEQLAWMSWLDTDRPDFRISSDVLKMTELCATADRLMQDVPQYEQLESRTAEVQHCAKSMEQLLSSFAQSEASLPAEYKAKSIEPDSKVSETLRSHLGYPGDLALRLQLHHDLWVAYMQNFYHACQIIFRDTLGNLDSYFSTITEQRRQLLAQASIEESNSEAVSKLSISILETIPELLGFVDVWGKACEGISPHAAPTNGRTVGHFFLLFGLWAVQWSRYTAEEQKELARRVLEFIYFQNKLY